MQLLWRKYGGSAESSACLEARHEITMLHTVHNHTHQQTCTCTLTCMYTCKMQLHSKYPECSTCDAYPSGHTHMLMLTHSLPLLDSLTYKWTRTHIHTDQHMLSHLPHTQLHLPIVAHGNTTPHICTPCAAWLSRYEACVFSLHTSPSLLWTVTGALLAASPCTTSSGTPSTRQPPPSASSYLSSVSMSTLCPQRCPDMEQELLARLSAYHSLQGVNQLRLAWFLLCAAVMTDLWEGNLLVNLAGLSRPVKKWDWNIVFCFPLKHNNFLGNWSKLTWMKSIN